MRKKTVVLIALLLFVSLLTLGASDGSDARGDSMGFTGASVSGNRGSYFRNPASLFFHDPEDAFTFSFGIWDTYIESNHAPFPFLPGGDMRARYAGNNVSVGLVLETKLEDRNRYEDGGRFYNSDHVLDVDACFSIGWKYFSAGLGISAGSVWSRDNILVKDSSRFSDLLLNMIAEKYTRLNGSENANIRAGVQVNYENYTLGILFPSVFGYYSSEIHFDLLNTLKGTHLGISYKGNRYSGRARLRALVLDGAVELHNVGNPQRTLCGGAELTLQIMADYTVSLRLGYEAPMNDLPDGTVTAGAGALLRNVNINLLSEWGIGSEKRIKYGLTVGMFL